MLGWFKGRFTQCSDTVMMYGLEKVPPTKKQKWKMAALKIKKKFWLGVTRRERTVSTPAQPEPSL